MKHFNLPVLTGVLAAIAVLISGCVREELPDNRDTAYGYAQFKLYKAASYENATKAIVDELELLSDASKIRVELLSGDQSIVQTLTLSSSDLESAEFGLRSSKLRLLAGDYQVVSYTLYDALDTELYIGTASGTLTIVPGGLTMFDLTANVAERGSVRFRLIKENIDEINAGATKAGTRQYTFDEITTVWLTLRNLNNPTEPIELDSLTVEFIEDFSDEQQYEGEDGVKGWQTSYSECDSLIYLPAGTYKVIEYEVHDVDDNLLEIRTLSADEINAAPSFVIEDNKTTEADVPVTLYESDEYIKEYYSLRELWYALDGPNWSYEGESWPIGTNWDFDKDVDLWGDQPGVQVHPNGRIASIDFSGFGISGRCPEEIGDFTQLVQLSFGNHNETNQYRPGSSAGTETLAYPIYGSADEKAEWRQKMQEQYSAQLHPGMQMSPVCALALREHGMSSAATAMYDGMTSDEISRMAAGGMVPSDFELHRYDMNHGKLTNGLTGIDDAIGNLTRLESLSIANSPITEEGFPSAAAMGRLVSVTDFEIYNCPNLESLPEGAAAMPALITVNISNNEFEADAANAALLALAEGNSQNTIQILYFLQNGLTKLPQEVGNMANVGMLDVSQNNITGALPVLGDDFAPEELNFDYNKITSVPDGFCSLDALDSFSINYNELEEFPNIFSSDINIIMSTISAAHNNIKKLPDEGVFNGLRAVTLTLSGNPIEKFPGELAATDSYVEQLVMQQCGMKEFPKGCLDGKYTSNITTLDLQFNNLTDLPEDFSAKAMPYLYGIDLSSNAFVDFPLEPLNILRLTAFAIRGQRNAAGERSMRDWPEGLYTHTGLRGFYIGSNDLRVINDEISSMIFYLDISDNPNIIFDASDICAYWEAGAYILYYDKTQNIVNCDSMLE